MKIGTLHDGKRRRSPRRRLVPVVLVGLTLAVFVPLGAQSRPARLIAVGDIHGAGDEFRALLTHAGLIDDQSHWTGGQTTFVQTGDFLDRGRDARAVMDLLMGLEKEAPKHGGRVEILLGNHETMNLMLDVRDVTPEIFGTFAAHDGVARQEAAYQDYATWVTTRSEEIGQPLPDQLSRAMWLEGHPVGFVEYVDALGPTGSYGSWLRSRPVAVTAQDTIFLHGGLSQENDATSVAEMVARAKAEIEQFDRSRRHLIDRGVILPSSTLSEILGAVALELQVWTIRLFPGPLGRAPPALAPEDRAHLEILFALQSLGAWSVFDPNGPLWSRDFAHWSDEEGDAVGPALLGRFGVRRAVVGHTPTASRRINPRFENRVFLITQACWQSTTAGRQSWS